MKKTILLYGVVWCLFSASPLAASPLYGGYNGQSSFWIDTFFFGIDNRARWWVRLPLDIVPERVRLIFMLESTGALSTEVAVYNIPGQGDFIFGFDTTGLSWTETFTLGFLAGSSSDGATWSEQALLDYAGSGSDNSDSIWWFLTYNYRNQFPLTAGINLSLLTAGGDEVASGDQPALLSGMRMCQSESAAELISLLKGLSGDADLLEKVKLTATRELDTASLTRFAEEEVFTGERREMIRGMMRNLTGAGSRF